MKKGGGFKSGECCRNEIGGTGEQRENPQKSRHYLLQLSPLAMGGSPGELSEELVT